MDNVPEKYKDLSWGASKLGDISIFKRFTEKELSTLYSLGRFILLRPKSHAVIEGEPSRGLFLILEGNVNVYKTDPSSQTLTRLAALEGGAHFGELSLFDNSPRSATVTAENTVNLFLLEAETFTKFLESSGENLQLRFFKTCAEELSVRLRNLNNDYISSQNTLWRYALRQS